MQKHLQKSVFLFILAALLTGCGSDTGPDNEKKRIAVLLWSRGFEFMVALDQGIKDEVEKFGYEVTILDGQSNSQLQLGQIEDSLVKKVDAIILAPVNSDELVPGVRKANEAGVPVITVEGVISEGVEIASSIMFDNEGAGRIAAEFMIQELGQGAVLETSGAQGTYQAILRSYGFKERMSAASTFGVVSKNANWQAENAQHITADSITANKRINGVYSHNDDMIRGILGGLRQMNKLKKAGEEGHILIVGTDGTPEALERIRRGEQDASVQQNPLEMGAAAVQAVAAVLEGREVEKVKVIPAVLITKDNVDEPNLWGNRMKE
ncbi:sugar ABC transporter substrate-binding protein [Paenibacillus abyssi]|uniref:D-ribose ABC transporter substrate-binding protein n=1 Tax=Paenibacillus abyssi TaxID=1340531 RepID=A0A917CW42_9BACL|nr:sugar ABC transporter substrate-binding protein [Paenibacillus abyssi]GGG01731.1 D-ribose ABC transporter substrate-binding protein [Paenibacillus abyssi]